MREFELEALIAALEMAREHARAARMDAHFMAELDHLVVTAEHNKDNNDNTEE